MKLSDLIPADAPALVSSRDLATWFGVGIQTIHNWWTQGVLPEPLRIGPRLVRWSTEEIRQRTQGKTMLPPLPPPPQEPVPGPAGSSSAPVLAEEPVAS
jgi:predicted DNA-binding transcriptional regulator AlpA